MTLTNLENIKNENAVQVVVREKPIPPEYDNTERIIQQGEKHENVRVNKLIV